MNKIAIIILAGALQGCAGFTSYEREALGQVQAATDALTLRSLWWLCEGSSIGAFQRLAPDLKDQVVALCQERQPTWTQP